MTKKGQPVQQAELDITPLKGTLKKGQKITDGTQGRTLDGGTVGKVLKDRKPRQEKPSTAVTVATPKLPDEPKNVLQIIAEAASNSACNPENMRLLLDMQKEIMAEQRRIAFDEAFVRLQAELPLIRADRKIEIRAKDNKGERNGKVIQSTPYATFPNIMKVVQPLLTKHDFSLSFETEPLPDGRILVRGILSHRGHSRSTAFPLQAETSGSKNNIQGWGSSQSYGQRYCTRALLNFISEAPEDVDTDGHEGNFKRSKEGFSEVDEKPEVISTEQAIKLREMINWCGVGDKKFCEHYTIGQVSDLPSNLFATAEKSCKDYHANQQVKNRG